MCDNSFLEYKIVPINDLGSLMESYRALYAALSEGCFVTRLILFSACESNEVYAERLQQMRSDVGSVWGENRPIVSCVAQPVLGSVAALEVHTYNMREGVKLTYRDYKSGGRSVKVDGEYGRLLFVGELQTDVVNDSLERQADSVFDSAKAIFDCEEIPYNSIVKQWNYVEQITGYEGENQHYQLLNNSRSRFYDLAQWVDGYPAATGIGADKGGVNVDIDALLDGGAGACIITPIDNKLQIAAHAYSDDVLFDANKAKATPKFERAKSIAVKGYDRQTYISGTAAIRGEESVAGLDVVEQCENTLENIAQLIDADERIVLYRVYLKYGADYEPVREYLSAKYEDAQILYTECDVCRDELLIEIEGISVKHTKY